MAEEAIPSFNEQLRTLKKGGSLARAQRFPLGEADGSTISSALHNMRRTVNASVSRVRESSGNNFRVESGALLTNDNEAMLAVVTVTRL